MRRAACAETGGDAAQDPGPGLVEIASGGSFSGGSRVQFTADDRIVNDSYGPFGADPSHHERQGRPGLYAEMLALALREGPGIAARQDRNLAACADYGRDSLRLDPPVRGFAGVTASRPDPAVTGLLSRLLALIQPR
jgi:hypothetical protein